MDSGKVGESICKPAEGCVNLCGMCPSCIFAPKPPGSTQDLWKASDNFKRRFVIDLILRCRNVQVLERIQSVLAGTSWTRFTYARSRRPTLPEDYPSRSSHTATDGRPLGMDLNEIWNWLHSSPNWKKLDYLCRVFSLCEPELLRMIYNLTSVLVVRQKRGFLEFHVSHPTTNQPDGDSEDPALMVVPGSSASMSGVSQYKDFIGCLPAYLARRVLGLLDEQSLRRCKRVCRHWQHLVQETMEHIRFIRHLQNEVKAMMKKSNRVSPSYANIVEVLVPIKDGENEGIHSTFQKVKPFEAAYAKIRTKTVQMEERNVYCGAYYTKVLLDKEDPHRVLDYRGSSWMATGSRDRLVHLLYVGSETKNVAVMKGHVGSVRVVLLCEERNLVITAGRDASIRCWNMKTDRCEMVLYGHTSTINCLDAHAGRLASGEKHRVVKVWSLETGKHLEHFNFKHPSSVRCVKINKTAMYSSCDHGLVKIWSMENASLLRVIDAHRSSVRCLFFDEWHLVSGDSNGKVMAWSVSCDAKECLMTFNHPNEVKSLTLVYLRVITGCVDRKIRIFNFLTGDCLKEIVAETDSGCILSLHFHEDRILVNTTSSVKLYRFGPVFWDYTDPSQGEQGHVKAQDDLVSEKSATLLRNVALTSDDTPQVTSPTRRTCDYNNRKPERAELLYQTCFLPTSSKCQTQASTTSKEKLIRSEKAACERMKKRGPHHPLTCDAILLRVNAIQKARCVDEASINMRRNATLRDSWGPGAPHDPDLQAVNQNPLTQLCPLQHLHDSHSTKAKTHFPNVKQPLPDRPVSTNPVVTRRHHSSMFIKKEQFHGVNTPIEMVQGFNKSGTVNTDPEHTLMRSNPNCCIKSSTSLQRINSLDTIREQKGFRLRRVMQLKDSCQERTPAEL